LGKLKLTGGGGGWRVLVFIERVGGVNIQSIVVESFVCAGNTVEKRFDE
jgi:hypothetical protein